MKKRHTVSIRYELYEQLQNHGRFGETFSDLLYRILNFYETDHGHDKYLTTEDNGGLR
ncbi:MAG: hypothetical protein WCA39_17510 [Nitrososphaeraceae archaeon]